MRKISLFILVLFLTCSCAFADQNISFVYINGSNNNNEKMANWFDKGVRNLHKVLRKKFLTNETIQKYYKAEGTTLNIKEEPVIFFWGNQSKQDLDYVKNQIELSKAVSSSGAYLVRNLFSTCIHDAIWVQKPQHMIPILDQLNEVVKEEADNGNSVVLYGYSAGTFITYEYLFRNLRYINLEKMFENYNADKEFLKFVKKNPRQNTCISALLENHSNIGTISQTGKFILNQDIKQLKANYLKIDDYTNMVCAPEGKVVGVVNYASPLPLFYSNLADDDYDQNYAGTEMIKYIMENGIFFMTINFREDPLGIPTSTNLKISEIQTILNTDLKDPQGLIYDNSGVWSKRPFPMAHTSYWKAKNTFAKAIVNTFINGYKYQYGEDKK
ncbi:hypothetical protein IKQ26_08900 [bacterium]|nr:hypothetical protein [bacterium]